VRPHLRWRNPFVELISLGSDPSSKGLTSRQNGARASYELEPDQQININIGATELLRVHCRLGILRKSVFILTGVKLQETALDLVVPVCPPTVPALTPRTFVSVGLDYVS
jgi:Ni,Fe-hydrogenase III small subunit